MSLAAEVVGAPQVFGKSPLLWFLPVNTMPDTLDGVKWEISEHVQANVA